jgi:FSR family fosmidomycin resistance protein-like MFS transporter
MFAKLQKLRGPFLLIAILYGVELLDELIYGLHDAALPYLKTEFNLTYFQLGLLFTLPGVVAWLIEPLIGFSADTRHRRLLVIGGIVATAFGLAMIAFSQTYLVILIAFCVLYPASGAYVNLAQGTLIDLNPTRAEHTLARWVLIGALGVAISPIVLSAVFSISGTWRIVYLLLALLACVYIVLLFKPKFNAHDGADEESIPLRQMKTVLIEAFRNRSLMKWIVLTELADLMLDKLLEQVGVYFHDVVHVSLIDATNAVAIMTTGWLIGNLLLVPLLERVQGIRILRLTVFIVLFAYAAFLLVQVVLIKYILIGVISLCTSSWYTILRAKSYEALPGRSGAVMAVTSIVGGINLFVPVILGAIADAIDLQTAMWVLMLGPIALMIGLRET